MSMTAPYRPREVSDLQMAFPSHVSDLMPDQAAIPDAFKGDGNSWVRVQMKWFGTGLAGAAFAPKEGVDPRLALRHLKCIQGSFEPKHEHKMSAVAFLMSQWFDDISIDGKSLVTA